MNKQYYLKSSYEDEFKRFTYILHLIANKMDSFCGDIFLDLANAWEQYNDESLDYPIFLVRETGCDLITRYEKMLRQENKPSDKKSCFAECSKFLGFDFAVEITPYKVIITNNKLDKWELNDLVTRLNDRKDIGEIETINYESNKFEEVY